MNYHIIAVCFISFMATIVFAQFFGNHAGSFSGFDGDFGGASFGGLRDSRQNRGPVVFPEPPRDAPVESSGVIVGASGYGFVPPQNQAQNLLSYSSGSSPPLETFLRQFNRF